jgi:hypothetical protein
MAPKKADQIKKSKEVSESDDSVKKSEQSEDSDDVSSIDSKEVKQIDEKKAFMKKDFLEKIVKYMKTDDLIRKETLDYKEKLNTLKEQKEELETYILRYLEAVEEDQINIDGNGKLAKCESVRKSGINKDIIKESIYEQLKKENIIKDEKKIKELADLTYDTMEKKREVKKKVYLKRTMERKKKDDKKNNNDSDEKKPTKKSNKKNT